MHSLSMSGALWYAEASCRVHHPEEYRHLRDALYSYSVLQMKHFENDPTQWLVHKPLKIAQRTSTWSWRCLHSLSRYDVWRLVGLLRLRAASVRDHTWSVNSRYKRVEFVYKYRYTRSSFSGTRTRNQSFTYKRDSALRRYIRVPQNAKARKIRH